MVRHCAARSVTVVIAKRLLYIGGRLQWPLVIIVTAALCVGADAAELTGEDARILGEAEQAINAGNHEEAVEMLLPLQKKYSSVGEFPRLLAHTYYELQQYDQARGAAVQAISLGRLTSDLLARLAQIDQQRDDRLALANCLRLLTILNPQDAQWRMIYGDLLASREALSESAAVFRDLLQEQPGSAQLNLRLGNVLLQQGHLEEAAVYLETGWHLGATNSQLPLTIAGIWQQLGEDQQAVAWMQRALESKPDSDDTLKLQVARMLWDLQEVDRADNWAEQLTNSDDAEVRSQAHVLSGRIAMHREQTEAALDHWRKAVQAGGGTPQLLELLGAHHYNAGDFERAAKLLQQVVGTEEGAGERSLRFLILSLIRSGNREQARKYLRRYIEQHGLSDEASELVRAWGG